MTFFDLFFYFVRYFSTKWYETTNEVRVVYQNFYISVLKKLTRTKFVKDSHKSCMSSYRSRIALVKGSRIFD